ncbi:ATP-grasp domain-containing protein [Flavobacterium wongokense]|uniref:ATP-grasp domain-containing protein n=1 Tax=Flavobacterium wongokense TaxID=2910674 RepID=UPI001F323CB0|nr:ATP-grasp domain-containing protein [Flavobacterium sp. WG47]MCF6132387.1 ATP-grasp domain-containing protein [Flavobacterium sp. WG47]
MKIALLTCEALPGLYQTDQLLIPELAEHNIDARAAIWDDKTIDWNEFDYLVFRNTWDYFEKEVRFNAWLDYIQQSGIKTLNAIEIIQRNKHKFYLRDLEQQGIKILPTVFIDKTPELDLAQLIPNHWEKAVIKPAYSGGSYLTEVFEINQQQQINLQYRHIAAQKELLLQEFRPEIVSEGETSFIFFNKRFSHCVNKKPAQGDFRVQIQFGGNYTPIQPSQDLINQAQKVVDTFKEKLLYARVDGIIMDNQLYLMEIECIEPDLYFSQSADAQSKFVNALLELIH